METSDHLTKSNLQIQCYPPLYLNVKNNLECIGTGNNALKRTTTAQALRLTTNKWDLMKLKSFYKAKDTINKTKRQPTGWERIFTDPASERVLFIQNMYVKNSRN